MAGQSVSVSTDELWMMIDATTQENCNVRLSLLAGQFRVAFGTVQHIILPPQKKKKKSFLYSM